MNNQDIQQSLNLLRQLYKKDQEWLAEQKKSESKGDLKKQAVCFAKNVAKQTV